MEEISCRGGTTVEASKVPSTLWTFSWGALCHDALESREEFCVGLGSLEDFQIVLKTAGRMRHINVCKPKPTDLRPAIRTHFSDCFSSKGGDIVWFADNA